MISNLTTIPKRVIIAATASNSGKTVISAAIMSKLAKMGYKVSAAKVGPDFIDPMFHKFAIGKDSINLDIFLSGEANVNALLAENSTGSDITIIEGVLGLFDGASIDEKLGYDYRERNLNGFLPFGSTAHVALVTKSPVVLVVDAKSSVGSCVATVYGFSKINKAIQIKGIIFNNISSKAHLDGLLDAFKSLDIPIVGHIYRDDRLTLKSRHLGLIPVDEYDTATLNRLKGIADKITENIDINKLVEISKSAPKLQSAANVVQPIAQNINIAVAKSKGFNFYYGINLKRLEQLGAQLTFFDPLKDKSIPKDIHGLYIGGGYPEIFAEEISANSKLLTNIKNAAINNLPIFAECGGLLLLSTSLNDRSMADVFPATINLTNKLALGYVSATFLSDTCISNKGDVVKGHEYHYTQSKPIGKVAKFSSRNGVKTSGFKFKNTFGSYLHLYLGSDITPGEHFIKTASLFKNSYHKGISV